MTEVQVTDIQENQDVKVGTEQFLTFMLNGEEYGVDILRVQEIKGWDNVTPMPNTPEFVKGVINLRGIIIPIVDLRQRFGMELKEYDQTTVVIVLKIITELSEKIIGIVVDAVSDVFNINMSELKPPPDLGELDVNYLKGLATENEKMIILLEIDTLLNLSLNENDEAATE